MKKKNILIVIIIIIASLSATYAIINIINWQKDNNKNQEIMEIIENKTTITEQSTSEDTVIVNTTDQTDLYKKYITMPLIDVNLNEIKKINSDVKGWLKVEGTTINYPFVQTENNTYYLNHSIDKTKNNAGWVFLDYRNNLSNPEKNTIFYAHNRLNETMFGSLSNTMTDSWYNNPANHIVRISTESENSIWQVFSVYSTENTNDYMQTSFLSEAKYNDFLNLISKRSYRRFNTIVTTHDRIITLSTCHNEKDRFVLHAKLIKYEKKEV